MRITKKQCISYQHFFGRHQAAIECIISVSKLVPLYVTRSEWGKGRGWSIGPHRYHLQVTLSRWLNDVKFPSSRISFKCLDSIIIMKFNNDAIDMLEKFPACKQLFLGTFNINFKQINIGEIVFSTYFVNRPGFYRDPRLALCN